MNKTSDFISHTPTFKTTMIGGKNSNGVPVDFNEYEILTLAALINSSARHSAIVLTDLNAESRAPVKHLTYDMRMKEKWNVLCYLCRVDKVPD